MTKYLITSFLFLSFIISPALVSAQNVSDLTAQINSLLQTIKALQAQLATLQQNQGTSVPASSSGNTNVGGTVTTTETVCFAFRNNLYLGLKDGETGGEVSKLQQFLKSRGDFLYPTITGFFGPATEEAVKRFQSRSSIISQGIAETTGYGVVGPQTGRKISELTCKISLPVTEIPRETSFVDLKLETPLDSNPSSEKFVRVTIAGSERNKEVSYWKLNVSCPAGVVSTNEKETGGTAGQTNCREFIFYPPYAPTQDYLVLTQSFKNTSANDVIVVFALQAYASNGTLLGGDKEGLDLKGKVTPASGVPIISSVSGTFYPDIRSYVYGENLAEATEGYVVPVNGSQKSFLECCYQHKGGSIGLDIPNSPALPDGDYYLYVSNKIGTSLQFKVRLSSKLFHQTSLNVDKNPVMSGDTLMATIVSTKPFSNVSIKLNCDSGLTARSNSFENNFRCNDGFGARVEQTATFQFPIVITNSTSESKEATLFVDAFDSNGGQVVERTSVTIKVLAGSIQPSITLLSPNGFEQWQIRSQHTISWSPEPHSTNIDAYLERKEGSNFVNVGKVIPVGKGSIIWDGEINAIGNYATPGSYYIRIVDRVTGATDRSDQPFMVLKAGEAIGVSIDSVNGKKPTETLFNGPALSISANDQSVQLSWTSKQTTRSCSATVYNGYDTGKLTYVTNLPASGTVSVKLPGGIAGQYYIASITCVDSTGSGNIGDDFVYLMITAVASQPSVTIVSPTSGTTVGKTFTASGQCSNYNGNVSVYYYSSQKIVQSVACINSQWKTNISLDTNASSGSLTLYATLTTGQEARVELPFVISPTQPSITFIYTTPDNYIGLSYENLPANSQVRLVNASTNQPYLAQNLMVWSGGSRTAYNMPIPIDLQNGTYYLRVNDYYNPDTIIARSDSFQIFLNTPTQP